MSQAANTIFSLQTRTADIAPKARRYTDEERKHALALYFQCARAYRFLQKRFLLPNTRVLRKNMERIWLQPSFHEAILNVFKEYFSGAGMISFDKIAFEANPSICVIRIW